MKEHHKKSGALLFMPTKMLNKNMIKMHKNNALI